MRKRDREEVLRRASRARSCDSSIPGWKAIHPRAFHEQNALSWVDCRDAASEVGCWLVLEDQPLNCAQKVPGRCRQSGHTSLLTYVASESSKELMNKRLR